MVQAMYSGLASVIDLSQPADQAQKQAQVQEGHAEGLDFCEDLKCCGKFVAIAKNDDEKKLMPFKDIQIKTYFIGATAATQVELEYINAG